MWSLSKWYQKVVYVIGWIVVVIWAIYLLFLLAYTIGGGFNSADALEQTSGQTVQQTISDQQLQPATDNLQSNVTDCEVSQSNPYASLPQVCKYILKVPSQP